MHAPFKLEMTFLVIEAQTLALMYNICTQNYFFNENNEGMARVTSASYTHRKGQAGLEGGSIYAKEVFQVSPGPNFIPTDSIWGKGRTSTCYGPEVYIGNGELQILSQIYLYHAPTEIYTEKGKVSSIERTINCLKNEIAVPFIRRLIPLQVG